MYIWDITIDRLNPMEYLSADRFNRIAKESGFTNTEIKMIRYVKTTKNEFVYLAASIDEDALGDDEIIIGEVYVWIEKTGKLNADFAGIPTEVIDVSDVEPDEIYTVMKQNLDRLWRK